MDGWNHAQELAKKVEKNADGRFVRLTEDGDKAVGVFVGEPFAWEVHWSGERYETCIGEGCPFCAGGKKTSLRVAINFFQLPEKELKIVKYGTSTGSKIGPLRSSDTARPGTPAPATRFCRRIGLPRP